MSFHPTADASRQAAPEPSLREFVIVIAFMMGLGSLSIDNLLPAFEPIRITFGETDPNRMQLMLTVYMIAFSLMQLVWGPFSDATGRRRVLMLGLVIYTIGTVLAIFAHSYSTLLAARAVQGMGASATRVLCVAIVRDRFQGREMARVMSLIIMVFILMPVIAPATGSLLLVLGSWHYIFISMLVLVVILSVWFGMRMPETLAVENRRPLSMRAIAGDMRRVVTTRSCMVNALGLGLTMGCLLAYLGSAQQIFETEIYNLGNFFPLAFAIIALCMGAASFTNSRLVRQLGMYRLARFGVSGFMGMAALLLVLAFVYNGRPPLLLFGAVMCVAHFLLSLTMPNFNAMAMEPVGDIAGTASSFIGAFTSCMGTLLGALVGQAFNGTVYPLALGYLGISGLCLIIMLAGSTKHGALGTDTAVAAGE